MLFKYLKIVIGIGKITIHVWNKEGKASCKGTSQEGIHGDHT